MTSEGRVRGTPIALPRRLLAAGLLALAAAGPLGAGCGGREKPGSAPARPTVAGVAVVTVSAAPQERFDEAVGTVRARSIAAVAPQVMGRLAAVPVSEGSRVAAGDLLAAIDDETFRAQLASAEGAVAEAEAAREEVERAVAQAEARKVLAEKTHGRLRRLIEEKVITPQEFDEAEAARTVAVKEHERTLEKRAQVEARIRQAKAGAQAARAALAHTRITAPFAGVVTEKRSDAGSMAVPGAPIVVLEDTRRYRIEASVPETYLSVLKNGTRIEVLLDAPPGKPVPATVSEVVPLVDPLSRTFLVKADVAGPGLRTGLFGRIRFAVGKGSVVAVPRGALVRIGGLDGLFVVAPDNTARLVMVQTGNIAGDRVEILSGVDPGDRVAVSGVDRLVDGAVVEAGK